MPRNRGDKILIGVGYVAAGVVVLIAIAFVLLVLAVTGVALWNLLNYLLTHKP